MRNDRGQRVRFGGEKKKRVIGRYRGHCGYCGKRPVPPNYLTIDHIVPITTSDKIVSQGIDINDESNLIPACKICNLSKGAMDIEQFRNYLSLSLLKSMNEKNHYYRLAKQYDLVFEKPLYIEFFFEKLGDKIRKVIKDFKNKKLT